ncbi:hypothetical protein C8F04DRAFT_1266601 [Mycena alexandri]|uniref:Uncharacterized protein n=1 Tax=Mycena alexandri TaxID=1745969 RepID=A0AAD6WY90_9AGAR|nr:hypothetical protein C8F04DRAFT_1266601 [Mycena alexandri]
MSLAAYATPHPQTRYSAEFFSALTMAQTPQIILPKILQEGGLKGFVFTQIEPTAVDEIIVTAGDAIPCVKDLLDIIQQFEDAYRRGARSVCIGVGSEFKKCHFSKIRLFMNINNNYLPLQWAARMVDRVVSHSLLLPAVIEDFKRCKFSEPLAGFHVTETPLYNLGCLLGEQWAMEDVINARAELIYFRQATKVLMADPSSLFLPTSFINDLRVLYHLPGRPASPDLIQLRARIRSGTVDTIGFVSWAAGHFSGVNLICLPQLEHGDSLHLPIGADIVPLLRWAFLGLPGFELPATARAQSF